MNITNKDLKKRILDISYKYQLSHLGSCLTAVDIIDEIYATKKPDEKFVLSSGHAGLALYVVLEKYLDIDAEKIWLHHGVHPDRCFTCEIDCSAGSLGQGLPIAVGMALADRSKNVYCLISDGEMSEGSIWEALRIANEQKLQNLWIYINANGWGAYKQIDFLPLRDTIWGYDRDSDSSYRRYENLNIEVCDTRQNKYNNPFSFLQGQDAHYHIMTGEEYKEGMEVLK